MDRRGEFLISTAENAAIGGLAFWIGGGFLGVVWRFLLLNAVELLALYLLSSHYGAATYRNEIDALVTLATPRQEQLRVSNVQIVVPEGEHWASQINTTFVNNSGRTIQNVKFWCYWDETTKDRFEDTKSEPTHVVTRWVLRDFAPHTTTTVRADVPPYRLPAGTRFTRCTVQYDGFDLGRALRSEDR